MTKISLDSFIQNVGFGIRNSYVKEPGFSKLYVRHGRRYICGKLYSNILDIANIEARKKGKGTFSKLIERLRTEYPSMGIFVECVVNIRFEKKLLSLGFTVAMHTVAMHTVDNGLLPDVPVSYYWLPKEVCERK